MITVPYTQKGAEGYFEKDAGYLHLCENKEFIWGEAEPRSASALNKYKISIQHLFWKCEGTSSQLWGFPNFFALLLFPEREAIGYLNFTPIPRNSSEDIHKAVQKCSKLCEK